MVGVAIIIMNLSIDFTPQKDLKKQDKVSPKALWSECVPHSLISVMKM